MGKVFKARDLRKEEAQDRNPYVAVKILNEDFKQHPQALQALQRESRKAQDLAHPNVVTVFDFDRDGETVYMTMEYLEGESLDRFNKRHTLRGIPVEKAIDMIRGLAAGLEYAHRKGVVHSDFKPANAFLTSNDSVKIFDFGIARATKRGGDLEGDKTLFDAGELGALTPAYASCEMIEGGDPDPRDDVYALAVVAYELMTGKHPFDKKSAVIARDSGMVAEPIKRLSRRQWRAIQHGLAFQREQRSPSVAAFMEELGPRTVPVALLVSGGIAAAVVLAGLLFVVPRYLDQRAVESLVDVIERGDEAEVTARLSELKELQSGNLQLFRDVFVADSTQSRFIDYYTTRIRSVWNPGADRYDYPRATELLAELSGFFPDSRNVGQLEQLIGDERKAEIDRLVTDLNEQMARGMLVAAQSERNVVDVLEVLRLIQPPNEQLDIDEIGVPIRFAEVAAATLAAGDLPLAATIVDQGLALAPSEIGLINIKDRIDNERERVNREKRIVELEQALAAAGVPERVAGDADRYRDAVAELGSLDPGNAALAGFRKALEPHVRESVRTLQSARNYPAAFEVLDRFDGIAAEGFLNEERRRLDVVASEYVAEIDGLRQRLERAVADDRLSGGTDSAMDLLSRLESVGVTDLLLAEARTRVASGFSSRAVRAKNRQAWEDARSALREGIAVTPSAETRTQLEQELAEIDRYEKAATELAVEDQRRMLDEQRRRDIARLLAEFDALLEKDQFAAADIRGAQETLRSLADLDAAPADGRNRISAKAAASIEALMRADQWDAALSLSQQSAQLLPRDENLADLEGRAREGQANRLALQRQERIAEIEDRLDSLMDDPALNDAWDSSVGSALSDYGALVGSGAEVVAVRKAAIAQLYVDSARQLRESERIENAAQQLLRAERYAPTLPALAAEKAVLQSTQVALREALQSRQREGEINSLKLSLRAKADALNIEDAVSILGQLRLLVPDDGFVTVEGPELIAEGYLNLARKALDQGNVDGASTLLGRARDFAPRSGSVSEFEDLLTQARGRLVAESSAAQQRQAEADARRVLDGIRGAMLGDKRINVDAVQRMTATVRSNTPEIYAELVPEIVDSVLSRIEQLSVTGRSVAERLLADAKAVFPDQPRLQSYAFASPVLDDPCALPGLVGNGSLRNGSCRDEFSDGKSGPSLVVIPAGGPFSEPIAIGKYEVTIRDYNVYCEISGSCQPRAENAALPLTGISVEEAQRFVAWLTEMSGREYRIPNDEEWVYAAKANGQQPPRDFNCQVKQNNVLIKGIDLMPVNTGESNGWGLKNYVGNAQEWVRTPNGWQVRGGAFTSSLTQCAVELSGSHSGTADRVTGFRVLRKLG